MFFDPKTPNKIGFILRILRLAIASRKKIPPFENARLQWFDPILPWEVRTLVLEIIRWKQAFIASE